MLKLKYLHVQYMPKELSGILLISITNNYPATWLQ